MTRVCPEVPDGEVYRIRFEVSTIESEADRIGDFFESFQQIAERVGETLASEWLGPFVDFVVYSVKRLEVSLRADFVEFVLQIKDGAIRILVETMVRKKPIPAALRDTGETSLRLINFLMPPSGFDRALDAERSLAAKAVPSDGETSLIGSLGPSSETRPYQEPQVLGTAAPPGSVLYRKHVEELSWNGNPIALGPPSAKLTLIDKTPPPTGDPLKH